MPVLALGEKRKYQRLVHTEAETNYLSKRGMKSVVSSNVSAVGRDGETLVVRFHGGATYGYPTSGDRYTELLTSASKGKFVWRELRRKGVPYYRMGAVNIKDDVEPPTGGGGRTLLAALALSTMADIASVTNTGFIASLALASIINAGRPVV